MNQLKQLWRSPRPCSVVSLPLITLLAALLAGCQGKISTDSIRTIDPGTLSAWMNAKPDRYLVVDVRRRAMFDQAHIAGATHLDLPDVDPEHPRREWERYSAIVIYGDNPGSIRAEAMTKRFLSIDPTQVYLLQGGFDAWRAGGLPVKRSTTSDQ